LVELMSTNFKIDIKNAKLAGLVYAYCQKVAPS